MEKKDSHSPLSTKGTTKKKFKDESVDKLRLKGYEQKSSNPPEGDTDSCNQQPNDNVFCASRIPKITEKPKQNTFTFGYAGDKQKHLFGTSVFDKQKDYIDNSVETGFTFGTNKPVKTSAEKSLIFGGKQFSYSNVNGT